MKLMHISDLHLGRNLNGFDLTLDQEYILNQILMEIKNNGPDFLLLCGDIYDKYIPAVEAVALFSNFLVEIAKFPKLKTIIISGNHDQAERLSYLSGFLKKDNIYIITSIAEAMKPLLFAEEKLAFCAIPFFNRGKFKAFFKEDLSLEEGHRILIENFLTFVPEAYKKIALVHNFILGGQTSESERVLSLGGVEELPSSLFNEFDYVALGHLHKFQKVGKQMYYSGSILKYSEKEYKNKTGYISFDMDTLEASVVPLRPLREMVYIKDKFANLDNYKDHYAEYVYIELLDEDKIIDVVAKIKAIFPFCLGVAKPLSYQNTEALVTQKIESLSDMEVFRQFYYFICGSSPTKQEEEIVFKYFQEVEGSE